MPAKKINHTTFDAEVYLDELEDIAPWYKRSDENEMWFERFEIYRNLGRMRNVFAAYKYWCDLRGEEPTGPPRHWYEEAKKHDWEKRAEAYDLYEYHRRRLQDSEERLNMRAMRRSLLQMVLEKTVEDLTTPTRDDGKPKNLQQQSYAAVKVTAEIRKEYGDEITKVSNVDELYDTSEVFEATYAEDAE